jgi:uncharacterized membrane protein
MPSAARPPRLLGAAALAFLVAGLVLFIGVHSVSILAAGWRDRAVARIGAGPWRGLYSVVAICGLVLIAYGYGLARRDPVVLYVPPLWLRDTALSLMVFVFPLIFAAYLPGVIKSALKHPMLVGVKLWAVLHLMANGTLADVLLFGGVLAWAVADRISLKRRTLRPVQTLPPRRWNDVVAIVAGLAVYAVLLLGGHAWLTGMPLVLGTRVQ